MEYNCDAAGGDGHSFDGGVDGESNDVGVVVMVVRVVTMMVIVVVTIARPWAPSSGMIGK